MPPKSPSELQRLEEERQDLVELIKSQVLPYRVGLDYPDVVFDKGIKSIREFLLRKLRVIERTLDIESQPYNSESFGEL